MKKLERRILYGLAFGVAVYVVAAIYADADVLVGALRAFSWWHYGVALLLSTANYALRFVKWEVFLRILGIRLPLWRSALVFTAGFVMSITPGKMGEVLKSVLLRQSDGVPVARTAPVVFAERLTDFIALLVLAMTGIGTYEYGVGALVGTGIAVVGAIVVMSLPPVVHAMLGLLGRLPVIGRAVPKLREAYESAQLLLKPVPLLLTSLISVVGWGLEGVAMWFVVQGFAGYSDGIAFDIPGAIFVFSTTTILGAVSFMPGGLGVAEVSMIGVLQLLKMVSDESVATAAAVITRTATLWWAVLWGFVAFIVFQQTVGKQTRVLATETVGEPVPPQDAEDGGA